MGQKKIASLAVCKDSKCFLVRSVHGQGWSTDTVYVRVHSEQVQTRSGFSGRAHYLYQLYVRTKKETDDARKKIYYKKIGGFSEKRGNENQGESSIMPPSRTSPHTSVSNPELL
jgi:hypothetical protein